MFCVMKSVPTFQKHGMVPPSLQGFPKQHQLLGEFWALSNVLKKTHLTLGPPIEMEGLNEAATKESRVISLGN